VVGLATGSVVLSLTLLTAVLAPTVVFALGSALALFVCIPAFAALQRSRFDAFLGERIPPPPPPAPGTWSRQLRFAARSDSTWRQFTYHLWALSVGAAGAMLVALTWSGGLLLATAPLHGWLLADDPAGPLRLAARTLAGVLLLLAAPWLARGIAAVDVLAARALLGLNRHAELTTRVASVERSRVELIEAADAERRRIERDLHDGMQQRLVALAMNLGLARTLFPDAPEPIRGTIAKSHDDAKQALSELRDVIRGFHPAILDDRGLDAALSGIVARSPVPARLRVDLPRRQPVAIEAVAYFVVSEALANVAKHASASRAEVTICLSEKGDRLRVVITDDGCGGARPERGTGLRGLAQRVTSVDGTLDIDSPDGGPTTIRVELPCGS
jgi:signal transduction histidine kinase